MHISTLFKNTFLLRIMYAIAFIAALQYVHAQDIVWANKLYELTDRYQFENNGAELVLGPPTVYPNNKLDEQHDPYSEGYILNQDRSHVKNIIRVGFPRAITAKQIVIGGIFNIGAIQSISIMTGDKKEKVVYQLDQKASKTKFTTFAILFPQQQVDQIKIVIDHRSINGWNIIKGIGLSNADKLVDLKPNVLDTDFSGKEKIGENISSKDCYEFSPKITPDGKTLYFVKECKDQPDQEIWYSELQSNNEWSEAKNAGTPLNNKGHNFVASISADGRFIVLGNTYKEDGSILGDGVSVSHKKDDGTWEIPKPLKIPGYENLNDHANFYMSADETVLLMSIQDKNSFGDLDLYASFFNKYTKSWSPPMNLGKDLNTPFAEDYPYLSNDGKTLYFSSKGYLGYGGHDIYMTKRLDDTWKKWSKPVNLGSMVNSKADDKGFTITATGDKAYFNTVNFDADLHHMDIYRVNLPKILRQNPQVLVSGLIMDEGGKNTVRGTIKVIKDSNNVVAFCTSHPKTGKFALSVPFGVDYMIQIDAINYFRKMTNLNLTDTTIGIDIIRNYDMKPYLDSGQVIVLNSIYFDKNSSKLLPNSYPELDKMIELLIQQNDAKIEIGGHTDNVGKADVNRKLSKERAKAVVDYFITKGIRESRLQYKGYGPDKPIADNKTESGRATNRRVSVTYLTKLKDN